MKSNSEFKSSVLINTMSVQADEMLQAFGPKKDDIMIKPCVSYEGSDQQVDHHLTNLATIVDPIECLRLIGTALLEFSNASNVVARIRIAVKLLFNLIRLFRDAEFRMSKQSDSDTIR